jgi:hypothetical protein
MGCAASKHTIATWQIEDSVHVALNRDKKNGNVSKHYIPRAPHPLIANSIVDDSTMKTSCCESEDNAESEFILHHHLSHGEESFR